MSSAALQCGLCAKSNSVTQNCFDALNARVVSEEPLVALVFLQEKDRLAMNKRTIIVRRRCASL